MSTPSLVEIAGGTVQIGAIGFDVYRQRQDGRLEAFLKAGRDVQNSEREELIRRGSVYYVSKDQYQEYLDYVFTHIERIVTSQYINSQTKAALAFQTGSVLVGEIQKDPLGGEYLGRLGRFIKAYIDLMLHSRQAASSILELTAKTEYRLSHAFNTSTFCMVLGQKLFGNKRIKLWKLGMGGALMDVGMTKISSAILNKKGMLSSDEVRTIQKHTLISERILERLKLDHDILAMAQSHHERYDGSGYPSGLLGDEIPLVARIGAVADVYDAITSNRIYRESLDQISALAEMYDQRERFDPHVLQALTEIVLKSEKLIKAFRDKFLGEEPPPQQNKPSS